MPAHRLLQNQKSFTKTKSLHTRKSSPEPSSAGAAEILSARRLLQNQKSLIKTESLQNRKSSPEPTSTADGEIFITHRLLQNQKSLTKTESLRTGNHHRNPLLRLMVKSSLHIDYCRIRNQWRKLSRCTPGNSSTDDAEIVSTHRLLQKWNHWRKPSRCRPGNQHRKPVLQLTVKSSLHIDYCRSKIIDENWVAGDPEINTGSQFSSWRWNLLYI